MMDRRIFFSLLLLCLCTLAGCQFTRPSGFVHVWGDHNTLNAPAVFVEELSNRAYPPDRLKYHSWIDNRRLRPPLGFRDVRLMESSTLPPQPQPPSSSLTPPSLTLPESHEELPPTPAAPAEDDDDRPATNLKPVPAPTGPSASPLAPPPTTTTPAIPPPTAHRQLPIERTAFAHGGEPASAIEPPTLNTGHAESISTPKRPTGAWLFATPRPDPGQTQPY